LEDPAVPEGRLGSFPGDHPAGEYIRLLAEIRDGLRTQRDPFSHVTSRTAVGFHARFYPAPRYIFTIFPRKKLMFSTANSTVIRLVFVFFAVAQASTATAKSTLPLSYNRDIRPILSDKCFNCHGPDKGTRKADLRLDVREDAVASGALAPGDAEKSEVIYRIFTDDEDDLMPPKKAHKPLSEKEKTILKQWVSAGADYQPHWSYITPERPAVPGVRQVNRTRNPIDAFVAKKLEDKGQQFSRDASLHRLVRRLSLDLTGIPPTPQETADFLQASSTNLEAAYSALTERLLASPHYGERMAVPWLDIVRFADTVGYHGDQNQRIFPYRDYVITAFNKNKPFDQFTIEQIAGDLIPEATTEQLVASGFNRLNMMTREGGAQPKEYLSKYQSDRVRAVSTAFLGSTMACAECHDHKFDPFTTKDFYRMSAFFADLKQWGVYSSFKYTPNPDLKDWSNEHPFPPEIAVDSPYLATRQIHLGQKLRKAAAQNYDPARTSGIQEEIQTFLKTHPDGWAPVSVASVSCNKKTTSEIQEDGSIRFSGKTIRGEKHTLTFTPTPGLVSSLKVVVSAEGPRKSRRIRTQLHILRAGQNKKQPIPYYHGEAEGKKPLYKETAEVIGIHDRWDRQNLNKTESGVLLLDPPTEIRKGDRLVLQIFSDDIGRISIHTSPLVTAARRNLHDLAPVVTAFNTPDSSRTEKQVALVEETLFFTDKKQGVTARDLYRKILLCRDGKAYTQISVKTDSPLVTRVLNRGDWQDENGEIVEPAPPSFLPQPKNKTGQRLTRLDLARWIASTDNPLTSRAFVNRLWKQFFGTGISAVLDDLGNQGEWPSHPELLDWLAIEFVESGWDIKHVVRLIVSSTTYRQSAEGSSEMGETDPANRLLGRQSPRRLEAEFIRDNALAISGILNREIGGPSTKPYQPAGYYKDINFPKRAYLADTGESQYRRGLYAHWQRTFLHPMMANFDAPSREECVADRTVSNTPQQALTLLNDPTFVEAARMLATHLIESGAENTADRIDLAFSRAIARTATPEEISQLTTFLKSQFTHYSKDKEATRSFISVGQSPHPHQDIDEVELAAWTSLCRVILNFHETITRY